MITGRDHLFLGIRAVRTLATAGRVAFGYAPEVVPLLVLSDNPTYGTFTTPDGKHPVRAGTRPCGRRRFVASWDRGRGPPWPTVGGLRCWRDGVVWFRREVPGLYGRAFKYTFEWGSGLRWKYRSGSSLRLGYKFHHLSNADTALANPGVDGNVFIVGFDRALR